MNLITQQNRWSCQLVSFAMATNNDVGAIIDLVGHDGSEIIFPNEKEPERRRGFHTQELIQAVWYLGWYSTPFESRPSTIHGSSHQYIEVQGSNLDRICKALNWNSGVLIGANHAVAWSHMDGKIYDPKGRIIGIDEFSFSVFYSLNRS